MERSSLAMLRVEPSLFSNVITSVQRTGSLTGGAVRGLPGGVVIEGLRGVNSFGSDIAEAQKEFELGRVRSALERVKQIEMQFNGIAGRWNSTVGSLISSARQGRQQLPAQKLNEVKNAQTRMQQLIGPATKSFRDLVSALEHAVTMEGRSPEENDDRDVEPYATGDENPEEREENTAARSAETTTEETPDTNLLGSYSQNYRFGAQLQLQRGADKKTRLVPRLECDRFYFIAGFDPPCVVRVRELQSQSVLVFDTHRSLEVLINAVKLRALIRRGIWALESKKTT